MSNTNDDNNKVPPFLSKVKLWQTLPTSNKASNASRNTSVRSSLAATFLQSQSEIIHRQHTQRYSRHYTPHLRHLGHFALSMPLSICLPLWRMPRRSWTMPSTSTRTSSLPMLHTRLTMRCKSSFLKARSRHMRSSDGFSQTVILGLFVGAMVALFIYAVGQFLFMF